MVPLTFQKSCYSKPPAMQKTPTIVREIAGRKIIITIVLRGAFLNLHDQFLRCLFLAPKLSIPEICEFEVWEVIPAAPYDSWGREGPAASVERLSGRRPP